MSHNIEKCLEELSLPDFEPSARRYEFRQKLINGMSQHQQRSANRWRILLIIGLAALVGTSSFIAIADVNLRELVFSGKKMEDGSLIFTQENVRRTYLGDDGKVHRTTVKRMISIEPVDPDSKFAVENAREEILEIDRLREVNRRKLVSVRDTEYKGEAHRVYRWAYILSDGRTIKMNESGVGNRWPRVMFKLDHKELKRRIGAGEGELLQYKTEEVDGRVFSFKRYKLRLRDGSEVIKSVGTPAESEATKVATSERRDDGFALHPNHPNPFNPQTTIPYEITEAGLVNIAVYNVLGQRIRTLVDRHEGAGSYQIIWDGHDEQGRSVASGTYLVRMIADGFSQTRKILLAK